MIKPASLPGRRRLAVQVSDDGEAALRRVVSFDPHLIVLDVLMPKLDGRKDCHRLRANQLTRDVIDTLGKRLFEVLLPIPKDAGLAEQIARETREVIEMRARLRDRTKAIAVEVGELQSLVPEAMEALD